MTKEDKELLLVEFCTRLPYGVMCQVDDGAAGLNDGKLVKIDISKELVRFDADYYWETYIDDVKLYLRPMSSMTEEEKEELFILSTMGNTGVNTCWESFGVEIISTHPRYGDHYSTDYKVIDWLNKNMFDYRGLIEKGLAIEAPEGMYK